MIIHTRFLTGLCKHHKVQGVQGVLGRAGVMIHHVAFLMSASGALIRNMR